MGHPRHSHQKANGATTCHTTGMAPKRTQILIFRKSSLSETVSSGNCLFRKLSLPETVEGSKRPGKVLPPRDTPHLHFTIAGGTRQPPPSKRERSHPAEQTNARLFDHYNLAGCAPHATPISPHPTNSRPQRSGGRKPHAHPQTEIGCSKALGHLVRVSSRYRYPSTPRLSTRSSAGDLTIF